jgi:hypothetical protein
VGDGASATAGPAWSFTTRPSCRAEGAGDATCDGEDDDCDGATDEDAPVSGSTCGVGACAGTTGRIRCEGGRLVDSCYPLEGSSPDTICNGVDEDCDGTADEDFVPVETFCGVGACSTTGTLTCVNAWFSNSCRPLPRAASDATCDGVDDDCDGGADEDHVPAPTACGAGACAGNAGLLVCAGGAFMDTCRPLAGAAPEVCDGLDNDCDGRVDEDNAGGGECAAGDPAACFSAMNECAGGRTRCVAAYGPPPEIASGLAFLDERTLSWPPMSAASSYAVFRGEQEAAGGWIYNHACLGPALAGPPARDEDEPAPGRFFYYLVAARNACGVGPLGGGASGPRPSAAPCA